MSYDRYVAICKSLLYTTSSTAESVEDLLFAGWLVIFPPLCLVLNLEFCDYNLIDHFLCDASPMMKISCSDTWFIEQMVVAISVYSSVIYIHHQDHHKVSFCPTEAEGLFYLFFSHDCGFYHLWQLYLHLCQTFSKG